MTINHTPKEMPTGDGNPTAGGAINDLNFPIRKRQDKGFKSLRAEFALLGHSLHRTDPVDGAVTYWAERWGLVKHLSTLHHVALFLVQIGGRL